MFLTQWFNFLLPDRAKLTRADFLQLFVSREWLTHMRRTWREEV